MKVFYLNRTEDESGVSGTGRVAQGSIFDKITNIDMYDRNLNILHRGYTLHP